MQITENRAKVVEIVTKAESIVTSPLFTDFKPTMQAKIGLLTQAVEDAATPEASSDIAKRAIEKLVPMIGHVQVICATIKEISATITKEHESGNIDFDSDDALRMAQKLDVAIESFITQRQAIMRDTDTMILTLLPIDNMRPC